MAGHEDAVVALIACHLGAVAGRILTLAEPDAGIRGRNRLAAGHAVAGREHTVCRGRTRRPCGSGGGGSAVITGAHLTDDRRVIMHAGAAGHECGQHGRQQQFPLWPGACPQAGRPVSCPFVHCCIWSVSSCNDNTGATVCVASRPNMRGLRPGMNGICPRLPVEGEVSGLHGSMCKPSDLHCSRFNAGNRITSRMVGLSVNSIIRRSMPMPTPPVGGMPYSSARM